MHGPVGAGHLAVFTSAVERIDDPDAVGVETGEVVLAFLAEHGVIGALLGEPTHQQIVSLTVALGLEHRRWRVIGAETSAEFEEEVACFGGELGGELMIVEGHAAETTRPVWGSTAAVSSSHPLSGGRLAVSRE